MKTKKRKKTKKVKKAKKNTPYAAMDESEIRIQHDLYRSEQLNKKIKRDNFILYAGIIFLLIYAFFQI